MTGTTALDKATMGAARMRHRTNGESHRQRLKGATVEDAAPCEACDLAPKCATGYACHRFSEWTNTGRDKSELSRVPEHGRYVRLFSEQNCGGQRNGATTLPPKSLPEAIV
jgi:hypothetical protein